MGLRINTNVLAMAAQHRLSATTGKMSTALERLSSGLRINSGKDDVVGLLKSESLRSQIRGIAATEINLANAQNLLGVAEGTLGQLTDIAQRIREQVVTAADDSISSSDRDNLQTSISDMLDEYNRLARASEFDGVKLLTGTFTEKTFQVGPNSVDQLSFSISDARATAIGKVAVLTSETLTAVASATTASFSDPASIVVNGYTILAADFTDDGVSNVEGDESAIAFVNAINSYSGLTGVTATTIATVVTLSYASGDDITSGDTVYINGVAIAQATYDTGTGADMVALADAINAVSTQTGVTASADTTNGVIVMTAGDGRNIDMTVDVSATSVSRTDLLGAFDASISDATFMFRGSFKLYADEAFTINGASAEFTTADTATGSLNSSTTLSNLDVSTATDAQEGIFILDNVIRQLQQRRSDVGSKAIRFAVAETELKVRKENLSASESRIRDADVAVETATLTAAQILQQAGVSVLARANAVPQIALSLLQG